MKMRDGNIDSLLAAGSALGAAAFTFLMNNALGIIVGFGGLIVQVYFNNRRDKREERELRLKEREFEREKG